jgi:Uma2 family endonuclease
MAEVLEPIATEPWSTVLHTGPEWRMTDDQFFTFCQRNKDLRFERAANGDIIVMTPEAGSSGHGSIELAFHFQLWARRDGTGRAFGSSTGFVLPNKATRAPDVAWVANERLAKLTDEDWNKFLPLCPDFVLELRSPTDRLRDLQVKMQEYIDNGARLGWLLNPQKKLVHIYRPGLAPEIQDDPQSVSGDPILPGFTLDIRQIWAAIEQKPR